MPLRVVYIPNFGKISVNGPPPCFSPLGISVQTVYIHSSEKSCFQQKKMSSQFVLILFKLHKI